MKHLKYELSHIKKPKRTIEDIAVFYCSKLQSTKKLKIRDFRKKTTFRSVSCTQKMNKFPFIPAHSRLRWDRMPTKTYILHTSHKICQHCNNFWKRLAMSYHANSIQPFRTIFRSFKTLKLFNFRSQFLFAFVFCIFFR